MHMKPCGDSMLLVECGDAIDPVINERTITLARRLSARHLAGVRDIVPGYCSVGIHFDPLTTDLSGLELAIEEDGKAAADVALTTNRPIVEIGVSYGGDSGPDLEAVASMTGCTPTEIIAKHTGRIYRVYMLGFVPGFAYMGRVDPAITVPRHRVPRERVPAGSVGIAGEQTGVYPIESPGGWQLIGKTRAKMFDPSRTPASLVGPGDLVRFVAERISS
jgi:KipI family sensor histidine kinase inhibitor